MSYFVYWLYTSDMTDFTKQGYIGISYNPDVRFRQHRGFALARARYPTKMQKAFVSGDIRTKVLVQGSPEYCREVERKLRPDVYIGWNKAIGADGGANYKHGLSGTKCKSSYYNLKDRATASGKIFQWASVAEFESFYNDVWESGSVFYLEDCEGDYTELNIRCMPRSDYLRVCQRKCELDGVMYSVSELSDLSGEKPNTISTRLKRGWSVKEATYGRN